MKQIVPVAFDPFAEDQEETEPVEQKSKSDNATASGTTKVKLEITLSSEVMSMLKHIMASLDAMSKPKKVRLIRDVNGQTSEAVAEYEKPDRLN